MSHHIALLGDSIFDNKAYTQGGPDVVSHLRDILPAPWRATLLAVDGSTTKDVSAQYARVPGDVSHVVLSIGGNDALMNSDLLALPVTTTTEALLLFDERIRPFEANYRAAVDRLVALKRDTTLCTIYNGNLDGLQARAARIGLMMFNDAIVRAAFVRALKIIDLRLVCTEPADYANAIEPSDSGGRKIAYAIARAAGALL